MLNLLAGANVKIKWKCKCKIKGKCSDKLFRNSSGEEYHINMHTHGISFKAGWT